MNMNDELDMLLNDTENLTDEELIEKYEKDFLSNKEILKFREKELSKNYSNSLNAEVRKLIEKQEFLKKEIEKLELKIEQKNERLKEFKEANKPKEDRVEEKVEDNKEEKNTDGKTHFNVEKTKDDIKKLKVRKKNLEKMEESSNENTETVEPDPYEEITVELPEKTVEEINEKAKNVQVVESKTVESIKIIYSAKTETYTINAIVDNEYRKVTCPISRNLINVNSDKDTNFIPLLEKFDKENNTNLKQKFSDDKLEYTAVYDLRSGFSLHKSVLKSKDKKNLKKFAKKQSLKENINYISNFTKKKAAFLLGTALAGTTAIYGAGKVMEYNDSNKKVIESNTEDNTEELNNNDTITTTEKKDTTEVTTEKATTEEKITEAPSTSEIKEKNDDNNNDRQEFIVNETKNNGMVEEPNPSDYKIGDIVDLENADLYYSSDADQAVTNTENSLLKDFDEFQITMMSVVHDGKVIQSYEKNASLHNLKEEYEKIYGDDFSIRINANALDKEHNVVFRNIGWFDDDNLEDNYNNVKTK